MRVRTKDERLDDPRRRRAREIARPGAIAALVILGGWPLRLPPDVVFGLSSGSPGPVVFRHVTHFEFAGNSCVACHPRPFPILRPTRRLAHKEMDAGRSCGVCHDGRAATATIDASSCGTCHAPKTVTP